MDLKMLSLRILKEAGKRDTENDAMTLRSGICNMTETTIKKLSGIYNMDLQCYVMLDQLIGAT